MSRKGGTANPFARTVQNTGNQNQPAHQNPPRGQLHGGRGGGPQQVGSGNPFAPHASMMNAPRPQQQAHHQQQGRQQQHQQQSRQQVGGGNPFAQQTNRGDGGGMEIESGNNNRGNNNRGGFNQPHGQQQKGGHGGGPKGAVNPFAQPASNSLFQQRPQQGLQSQAQHHHQQQQDQRRQPSGNPFAVAPGTTHGSNPFAQPPSASPFHPQPHQQQQQQQMQQQQQFMQGQNQGIFAQAPRPASIAQGFPQQQSNPFFAQTQSQPAQGHMPSTQTQPGAATSNPFFATSRSQHAGLGAASLAPPVRAEVTAASLSAVNASAALAPSKVQDLDLGLELGMPEPAPTATPVVAPPLPPSTAAGAGATTSVDDSQDLQVALAAILACCPLAKMPETPPSEDPYALMRGAADHKLAMVAGRLPAVPPEKSPGASSLPQRAGQLGDNSVGQGQGMVGNPFFVGSRQ